MFTLYHRTCYNDCYTIQSFRYTFDIGVPNSASFSAKAIDASAYLRA